MLLIAGNGRNSGKTTLACRIIKSVSTRIPVIAIKITPHFHENIGSGKILFERDDLVIIEESDLQSHKDSALMFKAGALQTYFVMARDQQLSEAIHLILNQIPYKVAMICESGGLRQVVDPGVFLMMHKTTGAASKPGDDILPALADRVINFDGNKIDFDINTISYSENKWKIISGN